MSPEGTPLDLNNFPEDNTSPGGGGGTMGKDDPSKIYECRFCFLKFCKAQALGGHMNRHRIERETETLNKARQLVFSNHGAPATHLNFIQSGQGGYPQSDNNIFPVRMHPNSCFIPSPRLASLHPSPSHILSFTSRHAAAPPLGNYYFNGVHALTSSDFGGLPNEAYYGGGFQRPENKHGRGGGAVRELSLYFGSNYGRR